MGIKKKKNFHNSNFSKLYNFSCWWITGTEEDNAAETFKDILPNCTACCKTVLIKYSLKDAVIIFSPWRRSCTGSKSLSAAE